MLKKSFIKNLLIVVCCLSIETSFGLAVPTAPSLGGWNEGDPGTTHQFWDFTPTHVAYNPGDGYTATPETVISPNPEAVVATISPGGTYDGITNFIAQTYLLVSLELPNYDVPNPYKVIWVDIGNAVVYPEDIGITAVGGIPSNDYICELLPGQGDAEFGIKISPNPYVEKITMWLGPQTVLDYIHVDTICVPEPASIASLGLGFLALLRKRKA